MATLTLRYFPIFEEMVQDFGGQWVGKDVQMERRGAVEEQRFQQSGQRSRFIEAPTGDGDVDRLAPSFGVDDAVVVVVVVATAVLVTHKEKKGQETVRFDSI